MVNMYRSFLILMLPLGAEPFLQQAEAEAGKGHVLREEGGIEVRLRTKGDSGVEVFRAEGEIAAHPEEVARVLQDTAAYPSFIPAIKQIEPIEIDEDRRVDYIVFDLGVLLVKDRDIVQETRWKKQGGNIVIEFGKAPPGVGPPPTNERVRMPVQAGRWELLAIDGGQKTLAIYTQKTDPGGNIPKAAARSFVADNIIKTYQGLRQRVETR